MINMLQLYVCIVPISPKKFDLFVAGARNLEELVMDIGDISHAFIYYEGTYRAIDEDHVNHLLDLLSGKDDLINYCNIHYTPVYRKIVAYGGK